LEEDVAKSTHHDKFTTIDFNRAGTPLMEIVSDPDIDSAEEAVAYLGSLRQIMLYGGVSDADMEKGQMRCDVNISVRPEGTTELGAKIELKNLNSLSAVRRAIKYETERQIDALNRGEKLIQSTRRWDDDRGETTLMRTKEDAHDYRYFPDPDLLPLHTADLLASVKPHVPELPHEKRARFERDYGCSAYDASVLSSEQALAAWYETAVAADKAVPAKKIANWVLNDLLGALNDRSLAITECPIAPAALSSLVSNVEAGKISNNQAKEVFAEMLDTGKPAADIIKAKGFEQVSDTGALEAIVEQILAANPDKVAEVQAGNDKAMNWFTGQAMKASQGKANPKMVTEIVRKKVLG
jgi:aspartyl-tRNA(Asn)/glutamyl-tRNA(Gln) amidotransferase subunit B